MAEDEQPPAPPVGATPVGEVVARGRDPEALEGAVLLLSALGVPHAIVPDEDGVALVVEAVHAERARAELRDQDREDLSERVQPALRGGARAAIPAGIALLVGHFALRFLPDATRAFVYAAGALDAMAVRRGEVHRVVTALTLHADPAHVLGNAVATAIFVSAAGDWIGPGLALLLTVLAGALGNLAAAGLDAGHHAIGFSTATFGALGLSAVFGFVARYKDRIARRRAWLALGAGLALLALLGAGERSDLLAHLTGLGVGAGLAALVSQGTRVREEGTPAWVQAASVAAVVALLAGSWLRALGMVP